MSSYPLGQSEADTITSRTGKKLSQITLDEVKKGNVTADDIKISAETLKKQGQVAKEADNPTMDANFQLASELVNVPDDVILDVQQTASESFHQERTDPDGAGTSSEIQRTSLCQTGT